MKALGGIRPDPSAYGMQKILIKPKLAGNLTWVKSQHESLYGLIVSNWTRAGDKVALEITIPPNTTATVFVPATALSDVKESGKPTEKATGVLFKKMESGCAVFEIGSGTYRFTSNVRAF
jgi:alpha-L-rhamnosidase